MTLAGKVHPKLKPPTTSNIFNSKGLPQYVHVFVVIYGKLPIIIALIFNILLG